MVLSFSRHVFLCHAKDNQDNFNVFQFFLSSYRIQEDYLLYIIILFYNVVIVQALRVDIGQLLDLVPIDLQLTNMVYLLRVFRVFANTQVIATINQLCSQSEISFEQNLYQSPNVKKGYLSVICPQCILFVVIFQQSANTFLYPYKLPI